jgi:hypothetical protein
MVDYQLLHKHVQMVTKNDPNLIMKWTIQINPTNNNYNSMGIGHQTFGNRNSFGHHSFSDWNCLVANVSIPTILVVEYTMTIKTLVIEFAFKH